MSFDLSFESLAAEYNKPRPVTRSNTPFRPVAQRSTHVAIHNPASGGGEWHPGILIDTATIAWDTPYKNTSENSDIFIKVIVSPPLYQGLTTYCLAELRIGDMSPPTVQVDEYVGTNSYGSTLILSRGSISGWIPPGYYYMIHGAYTPLIISCTRYWMPDPLD